jgi:hypothetical protein
LVAAASEVVVIDGRAFTVRVRTCVSVTPLASVIDTVKVCVVAEAPIVPLMTPVEGARVRPVGKAPLEIDQLPSGAVPPVTASV